MALEGSGIIPTMPITNGGFGGFGGSDGWMILLLLLFACGGFGNGFGGFGGDGLYPWMNNSQNINDGFRDQMLNSSVSGIQSGVTSGFGDVQNSLCGGFAGVNATITNGFANAETAATGRQMANMNQAFAAQSAMSQGFNGLQSQLASCCCDQRLGLANLTSTILAENCADRAAISDGIRDIITNQTSNTQRILDKICEQEIEQLRSQNVALQNQVNMQNLAASQAAQTAALIADNTAQTQYIVNRVAPYPIPAYTVANPVTPATT